MPLVVKSNLVSFVFRITCFYSNQVTATQRFIESPSQERVTSNGQEATVNGSDCIWTELQNRGIPDKAIKSVFQSWRPRTQKQYNNAWTSGICGVVSGCVIPLNQLKVTKYLI
jgi:hypothetical protein